MRFFICLVMFNVFISCKQKMILTEVKGLNHQFVSGMKPITNICDSFYSNTPAEWIKREVSVRIQQASLASLLCLSAYKPSRSSMMCSDNKTRVSVLTTSDCSILFKAKKKACWNWRKENIWSDLCIKVTTFLCYLSKSCLSFCMIKWIKFP